MPIRPTGKQDDGEEPPEKFHDDAGNRNPKFEIRNSSRHYGVHDLTNRDLRFDHSAVEFL